MPWFPLLVRNGVIGGALLLLGQALAPVLYLWAVLVMLLLLLATLYGTAHGLWQARPGLATWRLVSGCWGVSALALGLFFSVGHLRRGHPWDTVYDAEPLWPVLFAACGVLSLLVVAAFRGDQTAHKRRPDNPTK